MNWITTSGRTLDEAKSNALDQLGIVADEAEFDVVNDVEKGLFGRVKTEAKIRARVRPKQPAQKDERRNRNGGGSGRSRNRKKNNAGGGAKKSNDGQQRSKKNNQGSDTGGSSNKQGGQKGGNRQRNGGGQQQKQKPKSEQKSQAEQSGAGAAAANNAKKEKMETTISREEQEQVAQAFLEGVLTSFGMTGDVSVVEEAADDDAIEMAVAGEELGLLVGPKGLTLSALQELTRTVVQRNAEGAKTDRLRVDVAGYRARRTAALRDFAQKIAAEVVESGNEKLLEPMGPADRKVVHDAVNDIEGVETGSEGEEPRRRVVIRPAG